MHSICRAFLALAILGAVLTAPAGAQPVTVAANALQSGIATINQYTVVANQITSSEGWTIGIYNQVGTDNSNGSPSAMADFKASASQSSCTFVPFFSCTNWFAPLQNVSATGYQADPVGNSATINVTLLDTTSQAHVFKLTLTRPTSTSHGYNLPNAWVDPSGTSAQVAAPIVGIARAGYTVGGMVDNVTVVNNADCSPSGTCGFSTGSTWTQVGPAPVTVDA